MQFALVNNERTLPSPGLIGACPACGSPMIAKCGDIRIHHWAHRGERACDSWWEPETEWHRAWKNRFPTLWQEYLQRDVAGEKHIADVYTERGLTIEFQHSHLNPVERLARELFYKNMVWVVDGARLKRDARRFAEGLRSSARLLANGMFATSFPEELFPLTWLNATVPVFFDFEHASGLDNETMFVKGPLWGLLPGRIRDEAGRGQAIVIGVDRDFFVRSAHTSKELINSRTILRDLEQILQERALASRRAAQRPKEPPAWLRASRARRGIRRF